jgi:hypothetical protein
LAGFAGIIRPAVLLKRSKGLKKTTEYSYTINLYSAYKVHYFGNRNLGGGSKNKYEGIARSSSQISSILFEATSHLYCNDEPIMIAIRVSSA